jgi:hypothetical protein
MKIRTLIAAAVKAGRHSVDRLVRAVFLTTNERNIMKKNDEETRGFVAAMKAIEKDGDTVEAAKHHRGVASSDLFPDAFTVGWKRACDEFISANVMITDGGTRAPETH